MQHPASPEFLPAEMAEIESALLQAYRAHDWTATTRAILRDAFHPKKARRPRVRRNSRFVSATQPKARLAL